MRSSCARRAEPTIADRAFFEEGPVHLSTVPDLAIRAYTADDFDVVAERWHETNLVSYPYVAEHRKHTLADARAFFRSRVVTACELWVATRSRQLTGVIAVEAP